MAHLKIGNPSKGAVSAACQKLPFQLFGGILAGSAAILAHVLHFFDITHPGEHG